MSNAGLAAVHSEKAAIGAFLVDGTKLRTLLNLVSIEEFFVPTHRTILRVAEKLENPDLASVRDEFERLDRTEEVGGLAGLSVFIDHAPDCPALEAHAKNIRTAYHRRRLYEAFSSAVACIDRGESLSRVVANFDRERLQIWSTSPGDAERLFVSAPQLIASVPKEIDWLVCGVIERGANGFFSAVPKGGKSWASEDLAASLALGCDWMGFKIPDPVKVALISREDNPHLTAWRLRQLCAGKSCADPTLLERNLYVNTRLQSAELMLDNHAQMAELMTALRTLRPQFAIFDVFNVLHAADENDNQEMRAVLRRLSAIQAEIGCGIGVVHHYNKNDQGSITQRLRGSSAIAGWAEWLIGISMADEETKLRRMEFELKAAQPPDPVYYRIESTAAATRLELASSATRPSRRREGSEAARLMQ
jgi:AAA domain-containing protein/DnaB helicase-like protein